MLPCNMEVHPGFLMSEPPASHVPERWRLLACAGGRAGRR